LGVIGLVMEISEFWRIIAAARSSRGNGPDDRVEALRERLAGVPSRELQSFQNHYDSLIARAYRWDLRGAAYIINGGCSDDGFRYFRDWLISEGEEVYQAALADPESLARLRRIPLAENQFFGYVALELFGEAGDGELKRDMFAEQAEPAGQPWEEDAVYDLFPKLSAKYGS
jgi:hypothetical protein